MNFLLVYIPYKKYYYNIVVMIYRHFGLTKKKVAIIILTGLLISLILNIGANNADCDAKLQLTQNTSIPVSGIVDGYSIKEIIISNSNTNYIFTNIISSISIRKKIINDKGNKTTNNVILNGISCDLTIYSGEDYMIGKAKLLSIGDKIETYYEQSNGKCYEKSKIKSCYISYTLIQLATIIMFSIALFTLIVGLGDMMYTHHGFFEDN